MAPTEEKKEDNSMPWYYYDYGMQNQEEEKPPTELRIDADIANNRLIARGTTQQLAEVRELLIKLGEPLDEQQSERPVRVLEALSPEATAKLLEKVRAAWPAMGEGAELQIEDEKSSSEPNVTEPEPSAMQQPRPKARLAVQSQEVVAARETMEPTAAETGPPKAPPVSITVAPDGRLVLSSSDPAVLNRLESLVLSLTPDEPNFKIYRLKHASAIYVWWNLQDYYEEELKAGEKEETDSNRWWGPPRPAAKDDPLKLSKRRKLTFIYDAPGASIMVKNASPAQYAEIYNLINEWDQPIPTDAIKSRRTATVKIKYSSAQKIAAALKEVYRDLLSSRDKEFETGEEGKKGGGLRIASTTTIRYGSADGGPEAVHTTKPIKATFEGALSIGVDEVANILIVSAQEELFDSVLDTIRVLDQEAKPKTAIQVHRLSIPASSVHAALSKAVGAEWLGGKPVKAEQAPPNPEQNQPPGGEQGPHGRRGEGRRGEN
jgi:hypothetical protein